MPITATTDLPDAQQPTLGNGVEDEIAVDWTDVINYGEYDIQVREVDDSDNATPTWTDWASLPESTTSDIITGREDGEEYEVRMRTQTEHATGAWTSPTSIVTKFPGATAFSVTVAGETSVDLVWNDNSDNEDGFRVFRRELLDDGGYSAWFEIADEPPNTTAYTDATVQPDTTYEYYVQAYTEETSADSATDSGTTPASGLHQRNIPSSGPYLEVENSDGDVLSPNVAGDPVRKPRLNGLPRAEVPVPADDKWTDSAFDRATVRLWEDGERLPVDTMVSARVDEGRTVLECRGGSELLARVQKTVNNEEAHTVADNLVTNNTTYTANVDTPSSSSSSSLMQSPSSESELRNLLVAPVAGDTPLRFANGGLEVQQTCWTVEVEDTNFSGTSFFKPEYSGSGVDDGDGRAIELLEQGEYFELDFTPQYDIPQDEFSPTFRFDTIPDQGTPAITVTINGTVIFDGSYGAAGLDWYEIASRQDWTIPTLSAGTTYTLRVEVTGQDGGFDDAYHFDVAAPHDRRFGYNFDNIVTTNSSGNNYLDGPGFFPNHVDAVFEDADPVLAVTGGELATVMNNTAGDQVLYMSNDGGSTYNSDANTSSFSTEFGSSGGTIRAKVRLSAYGNKTTTPGKRYNRQRLSGFDLTAYLDSTPLLSSRSFDGKLRDVLNIIADDKDFIWEVAYDNGFTVEWTRPGQRSAAVPEDVVSYSVEKDASAVNQKAVIRGSSQPVRQETFTSSHGSPVPLNNDHLLPSQEVVYDESTGESFTNGDDYTVDWEVGEITTLSSGAMSDGTTYAVDYRYKTYGEYASGAFTGDPEEVIVETLPAVTTDAEAQQAALSLVNETDTPVWEARVSIERRPAGYLLTSAVDLEKLPVAFSSGDVEVWDLKDSPTETTLVMGSRKPAQEVINRITSGLESTKKRT